MTVFGDIPANAPLNDVCSAYDAVGGLSVDATPRTVEMTATHVISGTFSVVNGEISVSVAAPTNFEITFSATALGLSATRSQVSAWLERNGTEVPGTRIELYCRITAMGATGGGQVYLQLADGDTVRIRCQRVAGGAISTRASGSRLAVRKL